MVGLCLPNGNAPFNPRSTPVSAAAMPGYRVAGSIPSSVHIAARPIGIGRARTRSVAPNIWGPDPSHPPTAPRREGRQP